MKCYYYCFFAVVVGFSCNEKNSTQLFVSNNSIDISINNDTIFYKNIKFNGVLFQLHSNNKDSAFSHEIKNGLLNGVTKKWFANNQLMEYREYKMGKKDGKQIAYWDNGKKRFEFTAKNDAYEGEMKEWSINGNLFHLAHYVNGQEEGSQKMWYENGKIRANYVMLRGKRYGLLGTKNCKNVSDSIFDVK
jgi:antitoxin component YwqK of YwqJK toxin-antitoxin module